MHESWKMLRQVNQTMTGLHLSEEETGEFEKLIEYLQKRQFYDINKGVVVTVSEENLPTSQSSVPPVVSDQGSNNTCASHAMGKCITEFLDDFGLGK